MTHLAVTDALAALNSAPFVLDRRAAQYMRNAGVRLLTITNADTTARLVQQLYDALAALDLPRWTRSAIHTSKAYSLSACPSVSAVSTTAQTP